jgi:hypothetical protein
MRSRLFILVLVLLPCRAFAGSAEEAWNAYLAGDFQHVFQIVSRDGNDSNLTLPERARLYFTLGCSKAMQGMDTAATVAFRRAFSLDPKFGCSEEEVPPPVWKLFKPVRDSVLSAQIPLERHANSPSTPPVTLRTDTLRIATIFSHSRASTIKSLAFPGWGHISEGNRRGYLITGAETLLLVGWGASALASGKARTDYIKARDKSVISDRYNTYNKYYHLSWGLGAAAVALYLGAQFDFFSAPPRFQLSVFNEAHGMAIAWNQSL